MVLFVDVKPKQVHGGDRPEQVANGDNVVQCQMVAGFLTICIPSEQLLDIEDRSEVFFEFLVVKQLLVVVVPFRII